MTAKKWINVFLLTAIGFPILQFFTFYIVPINIFQKIFEKTCAYDNARWLKTDNQSPKIVFMGSSKSRHTIIPKIVSNNQYKNGEIINLGMNAATPYEMYITFNKNKHKFKDVKVFFYTIEPYIFTKQYYIYKKFEKLLWNYNEWNYFSKKRKINNNYFNKTILLFNSLIVKTCRDKDFDDYGYKSLKHKDFKLDTLEDLKNVYDNTIDNDYGISKFQLKYLQKLKNKILKNNSKFVLLYLPNHISRYDNYLLYNNDFNIRFEKYLNLYLNKTKQYGSFNPTDYNLKYTDFYDTTHLSHSGAIKYSNSLIHIDKILEVEEKEIKLNKKEK